MENLQKLWLIEGVEEMKKKKELMEGKFNDLQASLRRTIDEQSNLTER